MPGPHRGWGLIKPEEAERSGVGGCLNPWAPSPWLQSLTALARKDQEFRLLPRPAAWAHPYGIPKSHIEPSNTSSAFRDSCGHGEAGRGWSQPGAGHHVLAPRGHAVHQFRLEHP